ncbi:bZIP transcription factor [Nitzschia inconspicua]|uniref:BZIP transcription factor n=1 Tax=Nitzschia inconspicua TaxID=303405 RepID=A0A9K3M2W7_9STRA|nr:bZIP transcription factor [Nitzschia inconspicua]
MEGNNSNDPSFLSHQSSSANVITNIQQDDTQIDSSDGEKKRPYDSTMGEDGDGSAGANFIRKPVGKDGEPLSEKKLRRLEKNRLSARECRRRKREATENMERQINLLEGENLRLRLQLQIGDEAQETMHKEQQKLTESLDDLLKSGASESEIYAKIEVYKEKFADYGRDRRSAIEFHLRNVERLLMPTQTTSIVLATLQGGTLGTDTSSTALSGTAEAREDAVASNDGLSLIENAPIAVVSDTVGTEPAESETPLTEISGATTSHNPTESAAAPIQNSNLGSSDDSSSLPTDNKTLFKHLVKILQVTPEQAAALKDSRFVAQEMDEILKDTLSVLTELRSRLTQCGEDLETEFNNVRSILTPSQSAKFLVWVSQNKACMHMLNELWSKVYPSSQKNGDGGDEISLAQSGESSP